MDYNQIINAVVTDPFVIQANMVPQADGSVRPRSRAELESIADTALTQALGELYGDERVKRTLMESVYSLTATAGTTEYELPSYVGRVFDVVTGSDAEPLRTFFSRSDFNHWRWTHYRGSVVSANDSPTAVYVSGRAAGTKITFYPGVGSETSIDIVHAMRPGNRLVVELFPPEYHGDIITGAKFFAGAAPLQMNWEKGKTRISRDARTMAGGMSRVRKDRKTRLVIRRLNALVDGGSPRVLSGRE